MTMTVQDTERLAGEAGTVSSTRRVSLTPSQLDALRPNPQGPDFAAAAKSIGLPGNFGSRAQEGSLCPEANKIAYESGVKLLGLVMQRVINLEVALMNVAKRLSAAEAELARRGPHTANVEVR